MRLSGPPNEESNQVFVEFLRSELETAFTFLDVADTTLFNGSRVRNQGHARRVYDNIVRMQTRVVMAPQQKRAIQEKLSLLKKRLDTLDQVAARNFVQTFANID